MKKMQQKDLLIRAKLFIEKKILLNFGHTKMPSFEKIHVQFLKEFYQYLSKYYKISKSKPGQIEFPEQETDLFFVDSTLSGDIFFPFRNLEQIICGINCDILIIGYKINNDKNKKSVDADFTIGFLMERKHNGFLGITQEQYEILKNEQNIKKMSDQISRWFPEYKEIEIRAVSEKFYTKPFQYEKLKFFESKKGWSINFQQYDYGLMKAGLIGAWDIGFLSTAGYEN